MSLKASCYISIMKNGIPERIRKYRTLKGLTQQNIADELNLTLAGYSKIERGITEISVNRLALIADILEVSIHDLIVGIGETGNDVQEPFLAYNNRVNTELNSLSKKINHIQDELATLKEEIAEIKRKG